MKLWHRDAIAIVVKACVILHNLIIDYEMIHDLNRDYINDQAYVPQHPIEIVAGNLHAVLDVEAKLVNLAQRTDGIMHARLQADLIEHIWNYHGEQS